MEISREGDVSAEHEDLSLVFTVRDGYRQGLEPRGRPLESRHGAKTDVIHEKAAGRRLP
ncbi:hypothetical protein [Pseudomonas tohonis]|uniref:hypothetical protein n=1 Tax=Pseudomonas tohonis TaxID=2725477 RepID=UPI001F23BF78|nr:hypothetical protein [Pseudomonas tohonis]